MKFSILASVLATGASLVSARTHIKGSKTGRGRVPGAYIFEFDDSKDASSVIDDLSEKGTTRLKLDYKLFKGVSIQLDDLDKADETAMRIASKPAVKNMWPVYTYSIPDPKISWVGEPETKSALSKREAPENGTDTGFSPHIMTQVDKLHAKGVKGKGIKVAVIDTGIDYSHPALGDGCFGEGCIVAFGTDLVGDDYTGNNIPVPDDDPMDCAGHGTHVAGTVAARDNRYGFLGAAPEAILGAYRVFGCDGSAGNDVLIAAYNQAFEDGADIITASIGGPSGWSEEPWAVAVQRIVEQGVPCTVSAGNDGENGQMYASTASNGIGIMSIASFDNSQTPTLLTTSYFTVDGGDEETFGYTDAEPSDWDGVKLPLYAANKDPKDPAAACDGLPSDAPEDLSGYIVLIRRGECTFVQKAQAAADRGAKYVLFYNNQPAGTISTDVKEVEGIVAAGMVTADQGEAWVSLLADGSEIELDITGSDSDDAEKLIIYPENTVTGGALSGYTSWGPTFEGDNKPQFGSPGGNILSTWPVKLGSYAVISGTSMACPLVAGILALLAEVRGTFDPTELTDVLSSYAKAQLFNDQNAFYDFLAPVQQQGAGLVQAFDAAYASAWIAPSSLAFNDTDYANEVLNFTLKNTGKKEVSFDISNVPTLSFYTLGEDEFPMGFPNEAVEGAASLSFSEKTVKVAAGDSVTVEVIPKPPTGLDEARLPVWSGYIAVNGSDGTNLALPYQGIAGSLHSANLLLSDEDIWVTSSIDPNSAPIESNKTFTVPAPGSEIVPASDDLPTLGLYLALGSPRVKVSVISLDCKDKENKGKNIGEIEGSPFEYQPRLLSVYPWNGVLASGKAAPEGKYRFHAEILHINGDPEDKDDLWDDGESPAFRIKYEESSKKKKEDSKA